MQKHFKILIWFVLFSTTSFANDGLLEKILEKAENKNDFVSVEHILKKSNLYEFVPSIAPIRDKYNITSSFGYRVHPIDKTRKLHTGTDFKADVATSIYATASGEVIFAGVRGGYGNCVIIKHKFGFETYYAHLTHIFTKVGYVVKKGKIIGFLGNTGKSTGAHLHYEVRKNNKPINSKEFF